jgi:spore maturation protein CgeB
MLSDEGVYPKGLNAGEHFSVYKDESDLEKMILSLLDDGEKRKRIANDGNKALRDIYSKEKQWQFFQEIVGQVC